MKKIGIVILNYKVYEDTIECIKSIEQQKYDNYNIIVVDNDSRNSSVKRIKEYISNKNNMCIIENSKNLGFAKGNNVGILYAKEKLKCDFVFVINADTVMKDCYTLQKLISSYKENNGIAIINPLCCDAYGKIQMPYLVSNSNMWKYSAKIGVYLVKQFIKAQFDFKRNIKKENIVDIHKIIKSKYVIQGCAYVLTPDFFKFYNKIYPETFLYCEEMALCIYIEKKKLKTITNVDAIIFHKEGGASSEILKGRQKARFKHQLKSYFSVIRLLWYNYDRINKRFGEKE